MNIIVLLVDSSGTWSPEKWAASNGGKHVSDSQVVIEQMADWLSIVRDNRVLADFDHDELAHLSKLVSEPMAYLIEWKDGVLVERLLQSIPPETPAAVDNDHGLLVSVQQVAGRPLNSWVKMAELE
ncbi:hypothetical protein [Bradyrhizobium sp. SRS-191]|uniref:hypothetical protein n=1 Tax=Bradyrhizobium sp. SRS-191 TaxID=2962606 RepID=UPI00211E5183|nr:hypothetical protein [Bradyrhizobium sp. SRS-191]